MNFCFLTSSMFVVCREISFPFQALCIQRLVFAQVCHIHSQEQGRMLDIRNSTGVDYVNFVKKSCKNILELNGNQLVTEVSDFIDEKGLFPPILRDVFQAVLGSHARSNETCP